jgi:hypothetical protein
MTYGLLSMYGWFVLSSFFWLRGVRRSKAIDLAMGAVLLGVFTLIGRGFSPDESALLVIVLGVLTVIVGRLGRRIPSSQADLLGLLLIALGVFLATLL